MMQPDARPWAGGRWEVISREQNGEASGRAAPVEVDSWPEDFIVHRDSPQALDFYAGEGGSCYAHCLM
jgi:hypothetical protein